MRPAARGEPAIGVEHHHLAYDVLAIALQVPVGDHPPRSHLLADLYRSEQVPFLARMQISVDARQIPIDGRVALRVQDQSWSDRCYTAGAAVERIVVAGSFNKTIDDLRRDHVLVNAQVPADVAVV